MTLTPTDEQRRVIEAPLAPLRVEAGAGTGKTATIALRIAHLVRGGVDPEEVLGITFTNKAAEELADRVRSYLGGSVEPGREVEVHTYHGFAAQLLREFGLLVGVDRHVEVITPTFSRQLIRLVLGTVPLAHLDITGPTATEKVLRLGSTLGDNLLEPEEIDLSDPGVGPWEERGDLLTALRAYRSEKERLSVADFSDLVRLAHRLVSTYPEVATQVVGRYRAVFLDEYQDTNPGQRELLRAIFGAGFPVLAVGDPDQTIYEWRGASPSNFSHFPAHFPAADGSEAPTAPLTLNRRSDRRIVWVANAIRARVEPFRPQLRPLPDAGEGRVAVFWARTAVEEATLIADRIMELHGSGLAWRDVAVLFRKNKDIRLVHDALEQRDVPVEVANLGGLLSVPEVADLQAWLRILEAPGDGPALLRVLMGSRFRLGMGDLVPIRDWIAQGAEEEDEGHRLPARTPIEAIDQLDELIGLAPQAREALKQFREEYRLLLRAAQGVNLVELVRTVLDVTRTWAEVEAMPDSARLSARLNLYRFLDLAEEWSPLEGRPSLPAFLDYLELMKGEQTEELDVARLSGADAVALLTVHRAKALEWPVVFVPAVYKDNFPSRVVAHEDPYRFPEILPHEYRLDRDSLPRITADMPETKRNMLLGAHHDRQEWRIAYVAATRAKQQLYVSGAYWYGSPEPRTTAAKPSEFYELVARQPATEDLGRVESEGAPPEVLRLEVAASGPDPTFPGGWDEGLRSTLADPGWPERRAIELGAAETFFSELSGFRQMLLDLPEPIAPSRPEGPLRTSVTGLVTYASCPKRYYWSEVDRLPRRSSEAAHRGSDLHRRIELHNLGRMPFEETEQATYDLVGSGDLVPEGGDPYAAFARSSYAAARPLLVEAPFDLHLASGARVAGRIDAVYVHPEDRWEIVDFKSGRRSADPAAHVQLEAYALAAHHSAFSPTPPTSLGVSFAHLGGGLDVVSESVDEAWLEEAEGHLEELTAGISAKRFDPTPSAACRNCDFLRFCPTGRTFLAERHLMPVS